MNEEYFSQKTGYDPSAFLDRVIQRLRLKNDAALARKLEISQPFISKIRHHVLPVPASMLIRMHEMTEMSIGELRHMLGDRRKKFRFGDAHFKESRSSNDVTCKDLPRAANANGVNLDQKQNERKKLDPVGANTLLNAVLDLLAFKYDAQICRTFDIAPSIISRMRKGRIPVSARLLIQIHHETQLSMHDINVLLGEKETSDGLGVVDKSG